MSFVLWWELILRQESSVSLSSLHPSSSPYSIHTCPWLTESLSKAYPSIYHHKTHLLTGQYVTLCLCSWDLCTPWLEVKTSIELDVCVRSWGSGVCTWGFEFCVFWVKCLILWSHCDLGSLEIFEVLNRNMGGVMRNSRHGCCGGWPGGVPGQLDHYIITCSTTSPRGHSIWPILLSSHNNEKVEAIF